MTEEGIEAAISDAYYLLSECWWAFGFDEIWEQEERDSLILLGEILADPSCSLSDPDECCDWLLSEAHSGSHLAHDVLCDIAWKLASTDLQRYVVLAARRGGARAKRGRKPKANSARNRVIACATYIIALRHNVHPTRSEGTAAECGCSIVAKALAEHGIDMVEANVAAIWQKRSSLLPEIRWSELASDETWITKNARVMDVERLSPEMQRLADCRVWDWWILGTAPPARHADYSSANCN
jgi:hypothetical protein